MSNGSTGQSWVTSDRNRNRYSAVDFELDWLKLKKRPAPITDSRPIRIADAFCGGGIFSLGIDEGLRSVGLQATHALGIDFNKDAIATFKENFPESHAIHADVLSVAHGAFGTKSSPTERELIRCSGEIDVLVGGPPCQGNSDLNNHTRRIDPKNELYFSMVRLTELLKPKVLLIENVPGVLHDKGDVVPRTSAALRAIGYHVTQAVVELQRIGVPQRRKRLVVMAWTNGCFDIDRALALHESPSRPVSWAIDDLQDQYDADSTYNSSASHSAENQRRIKLLFKRDLYDLPNSERPPCHRDKPHSYVSVYGRMRWDEAAPTITGGFGSTGQGRFVHPKFARTLTPHEACRLQFVPDYFCFPEGVGRRSMQQIIGNAAPPKLSQVLISEAAARGLLG
ncbi:DNA cytosine methyltransferase [Luteimonas salinilitoris]|uniref:DNA (cytosine-5-)-methyltransferase n=1 Tax=Luteimonas salinilitoris TaxID=3237697 RepID=A0ABV4HPF9_9GAMM